MIVSCRGHAGYLLELLGSGVDYGAHFTYEIQEKAGGIVQTLSLKLIAKSKSSRPI